MEGLSSRPSLLAVNKMDVSGAEEKYNNLIQQLDSGTLPVKFLQVFPVSAKDGTNVDTLKESFPVVLAKRERFKSANTTEMIANSSDEDSHTIHTNSTT